MRGSQLLIDGPTEDEAFNAGWESVEDGPNRTNCHFRFFGTPENTRAWEEGARCAREAVKSAKELPTS